MLRSVLALLDKCLANNSKIMKIEDPNCDTEAGVSMHYLPCAMEWHYHLVHKSGDFGVLPPGVCVSSLELGWECPLDYIILQPVFALLDLDAPHQLLSIISISN